MTVKNLASLLKIAYPQKRFVFSTVTPTGNRIIKGIAGKDDFVAYLPLDLSIIVNKVLNLIKPCIFVIAETELWPNLIYSLKRRNIPVIVVNGRISDKSFKRYKAAKFLLKRTLGGIDFFCVQTKLDAMRLNSLGVAQRKIKVTGNMKFDIQVKAVNSQNVKEKLGLRETDRLLVAGSTHTGEEEIILDAYKVLSRDFKELRLLIAPRHPQRSSQIQEIVSGFGFRPVFISESDPVCKDCLTLPVFILDTIGELIYYYAASDLVFVGGSLVKKGGHNILEPAALGKPVIFGPFMFNFKEITDLFMKSQAGIMVKDRNQLIEQARKLLSEPALAERFSLAARNLITESKGATNANLSVIKGFLPGSGK